MKINEIFRSIQGESTYAGLPCIFVRLTGCNLRCKWCDTAYSFSEGDELDKEKVLNEINSYKTDLVEFTGGEPLLQETDLINLMEVLLSDNKTILLETNGSKSLENIPNQVIKIVDIKLPDSGEGNSFYLKNLDYLNEQDEIKFVINSITDYHKMKEWIVKYKLNEKCKLLVSCVGGGAVSHSEIIDLILEDNLQIRYQLQLHKYIWGDERAK